MSANTGTRRMVVLTDGHSVVLPICVEFDGQVVRTGCWLMINDSAGTPHLICEKDVEHLAHEEKIRKKTLEVMPNYMSRLTGYLASNGFSLIDKISHVYAKFT